MRERPLEVAGRVRHARTLERRRGPVNAIRFHGAKGSARAAGVVIYSKLYYAGDFAIR